MIRHPSPYSMERAGSGLDRLVADSLHRSPDADAPMLAWQVACGHAVAQRTRALDFNDGILRVEVPDVGWRTELQALAPRYVAAMNRYVRQKVTRVEFVISGKTPASAEARDKSTTAGEGVHATRA